jgi:hypothetical protein
MLGRKKQSEPVQSREGRRVVRSGGAPSPAFSYYASRTPDVTRDARTERQDRVDRGQSQPKGQGRNAPRSLLSHAPFWFLLVVFAVCVVKVLALSTSPKVIIVGKSATSANYLQAPAVYAAAGHQALSGSVANLSKLTVDLDGTAKSLEQQFPELQNVSMGVPLVGSRPIIYVQVAQPSAVVQTSYGNYALNGTGVVLARLQSVPAGVPIVVDQSGSHPVLGKRFLPGSTVSFIRTVAYQFKAAKTEVNTFVLPAHAPYELDVRLSGQQYLVRMNLEADARVQSGVLLAMIRQLGDDMPREYIDVRTPGRAYYK